MFKWYANAGVCLACLSDVNPEESSIQNSLWFTRAWTLNLTPPPCFCKAHMPPNFGRARRELTILAWIPRQRRLFAQSEVITMFSRRLTAAELERLDIYLRPRSLAPKWMAWSQILLLKGHDLFTDLQDRASSGNHWNVSLSIVEWCSSLETQTMREIILWSVQNENAENPLSYCHTPYNSS